ncbi:MFS transporter, partial [Kitasatospora sp. NPDC093558]|uniref:MFS transporter n=1 Tax=Kitasatospora sp. NPDC093558 TaxID=3155201 RepID=UPI00343149DD
PGRTARSRASRRWWVLAAASGALAMTFIDETGVGVSLATIRRELHASPTGVHWVMNAYMLSLAAFVGVSGRPADVFGMRRTIAVGLVVFGTGSLLSATGGLAGGGHAVVAGLLPVEAASVARALSS